MADIPGRSPAARGPEPTPAAATLPSPSEIAEDKGLGGSSAERGNVHGQGQAGTAHGDSKQPLPSPSQLAEEPPPRQASQDRGNVHGPESPSQIAEDKGLDRGSVHGPDKSLAEQEKNQRQSTTQDAPAAGDQADLAQGHSPDGEHRGRSR